MDTISWNRLDLFKLLLCSVCCYTVCLAVRYKPSWDSLDARPLPAWYDEAKIGIFLHWGVFSVPAFQSAWFWYFWHNKKPEFVDFMKKNYKPGFTYADFARDFTASMYNPDGWADIFEASGAKYIVMVTKHHEGYTMWPSNYSWNWNAMDVGPKRDLVGELATAVRKKKDLHFGVYHSLFEFYNPLWLQDQKNHFKTQDFVKEKTVPELYELVNNYHPDIIWSDGDWLAPSSYWNSTEFIAWLYNESPVKNTVVTNDRWGSDTRCKHGGYWNCNDKYMPVKLPKHKWENCMTLDRKAWTHRRDITYKDVLTMPELLTILTKTISYGGNLLLNVGPDADGRIIPIFEERLRHLGDWLKVNGEAIYFSKPWHTQNDNYNPDVWYTMKNTTEGVAVYAFALSWPNAENNYLSMSAVVPTEKSRMTVLGLPGFELNYEMRQSGIVDIFFPNINILKIPSKYVWIIKMTNLKNIFY